MVTRSFFGAVTTERSKVIGHLYSALLWDEHIDRDAQIWPVIAKDHTVLPATHSTTIPVFTPQP